VVAKEEKEPQKQLDNNLDFISRSALKIRAFFSTHFVSEKKSNDNVFKCSYPAYPQPLSAFLDNPRTFATLT